MKDTKQLLKSAQNSASSNTTVQQTGQKTEFSINLDLVNAVFNKLESIIGKPAFQAQYPDVTSVDMGKREYAKSICMLGHSELVKRLELVKARSLEISRSSREFPTIQALLGEDFYVGSGSGAITANDRLSHQLFRPEKALIDKTAQEAAKKTGAKELKKLREIFSYTPKGSSH